MFTLTGVTICFCGRHNEIFNCLVFTVTGVTLECTACNFDKYDCQCCSGFASGTAQDVRSFAKSLATAVHVPHVALMCARVLDGVGDHSRSNLIKLLASSRADVCLDRNTSSNSHSCILRIGVGDSLMIIPHLIVDFITG